MVLDKANRLQSTGIVGRAAEQSDVKRRWLQWAALIILLLIVVTRFTSLKQLGTTLGSARGQWILAAMITHLAYFLGYAFLFKAAFAAVEVDSRWRDLLPVFMASLFVNAVAPSGGASGGALWVDEANRRNRSGARTAVGLLLQLGLDMATLIPFLIYGMIYLSLRRDLRIYYIIGPVMYVLGILFFTLALFLAWRYPRALQRGLEWFARQANRLAERFRHRKWLSDDWPERTAGELKAAVRAITRHPQPVLAGVALSLAMHVVNAVGLYFLFIAFNSRVAPGTLIAGFGMGIVYYVITIVPQGLAAVEGVMALVFTSLGVPNSIAVAVVLVFRGLNYWLPLIAGAFFLHRVSAFRGRDAQSADADSRVSG